MQNSTFDFKIDEYEQSTNEFEKYVSTIPKIVPIKLTKTNTIGSLVKELYQKSQFTNTEELIILQQILNSLKAWGKKDVKNDNSRIEQVIRLGERQNELRKQLEEIERKIKGLSEEIEIKSAETNGFSSEKEIEDVIEILNVRIGKLENRGKEKEKFILQMQDLKAILPQVRYIQKLVAALEVLEREKDLLIEYLEDIDKRYEQLSTDADD
jgi:hypothetical protein